MIGKILNKNIMSLLTEMYNESSLDEGLKLITVQDVKKALKGKTIKVISTDDDEIYVEWKEEDEEAVQKYMDKMETKGYEVRVEILAKDAGTGEGYIKNPPRD